MYSAYSSRALRTSSNKWTLESFEPVTERLVSTLLFVHPGLRQPGYKAEAVLQSRLHRLTDIQSSRHVTHHASLSAALWLPWWVTKHSPLPLSWTPVCVKKYLMKSLVLYLEWHILVTRSHMCEVSDLRIFFQILGIISFQTGLQCFGKYIYLIRIKNQAMPLRLLPGFLLISKLPILLSVVMYRHESGISLLTETAKIEYFPK